MSNTNIDLARYDELPQELTSTKVTEIKQAINVPRVNVNITSYRIYDEDEHIVGEWRETIDGVKKKKPVYEKMWTQLNQSITPNSPITISGLGVLPQIDNICDSLVETNSNTWIQMFFPRIDYNKSENYIRIESKEAITLNILLLKYTKTTDEWEEVDE